MAYLDGINQYLDEGKTPIEFSLVGKAEVYYYGCLQYFGYMSFSFAMAQKIRPLLTDIRTSMEWSM
jgi:penicillin amidase